MYTDFYNLKEKPFSLSPSNRFLYLGEVHKEALALLKYGVSERKGFTLLTGEVGTGKTTMIHALLAELDEETICVHVSNPLLSPREFLEYLSYSVFKKKVTFKSKTDFLIEFEAFLKKCLQHQKVFILIIDEAHKLSFELLEEIRLLSNMETADEKLINIFLAGQPELNEKLSQPRCRALLQRISTRYHIDPLDLKSTQEYIIRRFKLAGAENGHKIFSPGVIKCIHHYSEGYPRVVNILADNALLLGYARGTRKILPSMVKECFEDLQLNSPRPKETPNELPLRDDKKQVSVLSFMSFKLVTVFVLLLAASAVAINLYGKVFLRFFSPQSIRGNSTSDGSISKERLLAKKAIEQNFLELTEKTRGGKETGFVSDTPEQQFDETEKTPLVPLGNNIHDNMATPVSTTVTVKEGETIVALAANIYGRSDEDILNLVMEHNPGLKDINYIDVGQKIVFPAMPESNQGVTFTVHIASFIPFENARQTFLDLLEKGYESYLIPINSPKEGKIFRITLGNFKNAGEAEKYASEILKNNISEFAKVIKLDMK